VPQFVRAGLRTNRWLETESLTPQEFPADVITDLRTQGNKLSVYEVDASINAERIAIAIAAGKQKPDETGYAVFGREAVEALGIEIEKTKGGTADAAVNARHYDLHVGTASKLLELAGIIAHGDIVPILGKRVEELLRVGLSSGQLDRARINKKLRQMLEPNAAGQP
jgi:hypothetical protein